MAVLTVHHLAFAFGLLGNIVSFMVYLAPVPTFYRIFKKKSTEGFQSIPYSVALFSATLTLYYGLLKPNGFMLVTINTIGCAIEGTYLTMYMIFAPKPTKISTAKLIFLFNTTVYGSIVFCTYQFSQGPLRITVVGWICAVFSVCVYAAPLSIMRQVIKTKSVEYMPFPLSFFLTLCASMWFFYGLLIKDYFIALPNTLGFLFGISQMILYFIYKNSQKVLLPEHKLQELVTASDILSKPAEMATPEMATIPESGRVSADSSRPEEAAVNDGAGNRPLSNTTEPSEENV
ncbi:bidirectional sugar transporter SWEET9-like [Malania oleifera]|uniref:bidirectional sugar transporter SWEET9-like n=1 Tax=Malania oleifera TaxID=397392 RepID=UPI0025AEC1D6|nr:bidirectional sugar transporter SWEET9-like [Malania oleifera]